MKRDRYLAAISREDLTAEMIENSDYRVCSDHFVTGKAAKFYEFTSPNWLPTLNLGHTKRNSNADYARYERAKRRGDEQKLREEEDHLLTQQIEVVSMTELGSITNEIIQETIRETVEEEAIFESSKAMFVDYLILDSVKFCLSDIIKEAMDLEMIRLS